jgi:DNA-binding transcriptional LysR family regulator
MDFKIRTLRYFVSVAEHASITRAAQQLNVAQPSLSQRIRALEEFLGFDLFERVRGQIEMTGEGRAFLPIARQLVYMSDDAGAMVRSLRHRSNETLRLGSSWFSVERPEYKALIERFGEEYPQYGLVVTREAYSPALFSHLRNRELDCAFVSGPVDESEFDRVVLPVSVLDLLVPVESLAAAQTAIPVDGLRDLQVAWYRWEDNPKMYETTGRKIESYGGIIVSPPDTHRDALARYAQRHRIATFAIGALTREMDDMKVVPIEGDPLTVEWSLVKLKGECQTVRQRFWNLAMRLFPQVSVVEPV